MKGHLVSVGFVAAVLTTDTSAASVADRLKVLRDKARPIIILSDSDDDPRVARQISAFDKAKAALGERDIAILRETKPRSALRRSLGVPEIGFAVVLVGKDGSVKQVWRDTVTPNAIVRIVDAMPMRRDEMMRRRRSH